MSSRLEGAGPARVLVAGAGIAGLEYAFALADMAGRRAEITVIAPHDELHLKPMVVTEPFGGSLERFPFATELERRGVGFIRDKVASVNAKDRRIELRSGPCIGYDALMVCVGGTVRPAYSLATTFWSTSSHFPIDEYILGAAASESGTLALILPPGSTWPLPIYELALLIRRRAEELSRTLEIRVFTPERTPLALFGVPASSAVAARLRARHIEVETEVDVIATEGRLRRSGGSAIDAGRAIALPSSKDPSFRACLTTPTASSRSMSTAGSWEPSTSMRPATAPPSRSSRVESRRFRRTPPLSILQPSSARPLTHDLSSPSSAVSC